LSARVPVKNVKYAVPETFFTVSPSFLFAKCFIRHNFAANCYLYDENKLQDSDYIVDSNKFAGKRNIFDVVFL
jgi:hypothetical protein